jgi:hypothetical protein
MYGAFGAVIVFTLIGFLVKPENRDAAFVTSPVNVH